MSTFGYTRGSAACLGSEVAALKAAGASRVFTDTTTLPRGRPGLDQLMAVIGQGDRLLVVRLDQLAPSTRALLERVVGLAGRGVSLASLAEAWVDTLPPRGNAVITVLQGLRAFERGLAASRIAKGRGRARMEGMRLGRPPKLSIAQRAQALTDLEDGRLSQAELARRLSLSESTVSRMATKQAERPLPDSETARAARAFLRRLEGEYAPIDAILYGSRARGTHTPESDADIAVILKGRKGDRYRAVRDLADAAHEVLLETGIFIQPLPIWQGELERPETFGNPALLDRIRREGLRL